MGYEFLGTQLSSGRLKKIQGMLKKTLSEDFEPGEMLVVFNAKHKALDILVETMWTTHFRRIDYRTGELLCPARDEYDKGRFPLKIGTHELYGSMLGYIECFRWIADRFKSQEQIEGEMDSIFGERV